MQKKTKDDLEDFGAFLFVIALLATVFFYALFNGAFG